MKFSWNKIPEDKTFEPDKNDEGWIALKESTNMWIVQLQALPFLILNMFVVLLFMGLFGIQFELNYIELLISLIILVPIHELIHALFFPEKLSSDNVYFGFLLKGLAFFAAYIGQMKRNEFIRVLISPLVIMSVIGMIILIIIGHNNILEHIIVINAVAACVDTMGVFMILRQVPKNTIVKNKGLKTYWKEEKVASESDFA
jgi:hypothetical protein